MRPVGAAHERERRRQRAVERRHRGESPTVIARILGVGRTALDRGLALAKKSPEALAAKPHPGATPRRTDEPVKPLEGLLLKGAKAHGGHDDLRSAHRVAEGVRRHFGAGYHTEHVRKIIRRRLRWSSRRPRRKAERRDDESIAH
jgi:transposase